MKYTVLFLVLSVTLECNGRLPIIGGFLSTAHKHIHDTAHNAAGTVLGALNVNFEHHVSIGHGQAGPPPPPPENKPPETVVIVVERPSNDGPHGHEPHPPHYGHHNDYDMPHYPPHGHRPGHGHGHPYNYNYHGNPNYGHGRPDQNMYGPDYGYNNNNNNQNNYRPQHPNYNPNYNQNQNPNQVAPDQNIPQTSSTTEREQSTVSPKPVATQKPTTKPDDEPLFVPLNPDQYVYGGDKITVDAPKRETDANKPSSDDDDENYGIDIRSQDQ